VNPVLKTLLSLDRFDGTSVSTLATFTNLVKKGTSEEKLVLNPKNSIVN
jgi:hypothetical protein